MVISLWFLTLFQWQNFEDSSATFVSTFSNFVQHVVRNKYTLFMIYRFAEVVARKLKICQNQVFSTESYDILYYFTSMPWNKCYFVMLLVTWSFIQVFLAYFMRNRKKIYSSSCHFIWITRSMPGLFLMCTHVCRGFYVAY